MIHIGNLIKEELKRQRFSVVRFAKEMHCDRTNIYKMFERSSVDSDILFRASIVLKHNFFEDYSKEYKDNLEK